ncbi:MAG: complex I NDUFA9 subunit family protein [Pseudomonadota bacterium]
MAFRAAEPKVVTVVGGSGFLGRYIVRELALRGWRVRVAVRNTDRALFLRPMGVVGQIVPVFCNIRDDASVAACVDGADIVINLVGLLYEKGRQTFDAAHSDGAARIARLAKQAGVGRLIHVSALGASSASPSRYAQTKATAEEGVLAAFPEATIVRPSIVFGPEDGFFNLFARLSRYAPMLPLIGGGNTRFQPVYVVDVASAVIACLDNAQTEGQTYELGGPKIYSFKQLMELILTETRRKRGMVRVPWWAARIQATFLGMMPKPLLTRDQVVLLQADNVVSPEAKTLSDLGIEPTPVETVLPTYLDKYRVGGRYASSGLAAPGNGGSA